VSYPTARRFRPMHSPDPLPITDDETSPFREHKQWGQRPLLTQLDDRYGEYREAENDPATAAILAVSMLMGPATWSGGNTREERRLFRQTLNWVSRHYGKAATKWKGETDE